jgi:mono/diheme cytochrome c family protein
LLSELAGWIILLAGGSLAQQGPPDNQNTAETAPTERPRPATPASSPVKDAGPARLYRAACLECHDNDGRGAVGRDVFPRVPDFTSAKWHTSRSDADLRRSILDGKGKSMPRMRDKLGSIDVMLMVAFVRAFQGGNQVVEDEEQPAAVPAESTAPAPTPTTPPSLRPAPPSPLRVPAEKNQQGAALFQRFCARCHGADGIGARVRDTMPAIPNFTQDAWHHSRNDFELVVSILDGKNTQMPSFRDKVSRAAAQDLIAFIRAFDPSWSQPTGRNTANDFEARFRELVEELENLRRQSRTLSQPTAGEKASSGKRPSSAQPESE